MMTYIYTNGYDKMSVLGQTIRIGSLQNGTIYDERENMVGSYDSGTIYSGWGLSKASVGSVSGGYVYDRYGSTVGTYSGRSIYSGSGLYAEEVGSCSDSSMTNIAAGAALLLLDIKRKSESVANRSLITSYYTEEDSPDSNTSSSSDYDYEYTGSSGGYSSSSSSGGSGGAIIFSIIVFVLLYFFVTKGKDMLASSSFTSSVHNTQNETSSSTPSLDLPSRYLSSTNTDSSITGLYNDSEDVSFGQYVDIHGKIHRDCLKFWVRNGQGYANVESIKINAEDINYISGKLVYGALSDGRCENGGSCVVRMYGDGSLLFTSGNLDSRSNAETFSLDVSKVSVLQIEVQTSRAVFAECLVDITSVK